jgi:hypothetical protein
MGEPNRVLSLNTLENPNVEQLCALDWHFIKILVVNTVVIVAGFYVWFTAPMTFCVLPALTPK